jgi:hypothetical protein
MSDHPWIRIAPVGSWIRRGGDCQGTETDRLARTSSGDIPEYWRIGVRRCRRGLRDQVTCSACGAQQLHELR